MHSTETEIALIQEKLKELDKLLEGVANFKITYQADRLEVQNLLRLITSLKTILAVLATTVIGSIATAILSRHT